MARQAVEIVSRFGISFSRGSRASGQLIEKEILLVGARSRSCYCFDEAEVDLGLSPASYWICLITVRLACLVNRTSNLKVHGFLHVATDLPREFGVKSENQIKMDLPVDPGDAEKMEWSTIISNNKRKSASVEQDVICKKNMLSKPKKISAGKNEFSREQNSLGDRIIPTISAFQEDNRGPYTIGVDSSCDS
jgi:hypothetical protein